MIKIVISLFILIYSISYGQFTKVVYKEVNFKIKTYKNLPKRAEFINLTEKLKGKINFELYFNDSKALFKKEDILIKQDRNSITAHILASPLGLEAVLFHDTKTNARITRGLKVNYPQKQYDWKLTGKTKIILGYTCHEVIAIYKYFDYQRDIEASYKVRAWFTKQIKAHWGPFRLINLPGLVLEGCSDGKKTFRATKMSEVKKFPKIPKYYEEKSYLENAKDLYVKAKRRIKEGKKLRLLREKKNK